MFRPAVIDARPCLVPTAPLSSRIASLALHSQLLYVAPVLQLLALCIGCLDSFEKVVDPAGFGFSFRLTLSFVLGTMAFGGVERVIQSGEELAARILEDEHGHDDRHLGMLAWV